MADSKGPVASPPDDTSQQWYTAEVPELSSQTRDVLERYSKIPPTQIDEHLRTIRDKAWAVHSYPCIGRWRFLDLSIGQHKLYPEVLKRMLTGEQVYLDLGCAFAQDIRRLVADGVDSKQCYASDLQLDFIELGYELFRDKNTLKTEFIAADVFDLESPLKALEGKVDIINASSFFHLFSWDEQKQVGIRVTRLLKQQKDSLLVGRQIGHKNPAEKPRRLVVGSRYRHNEESWRRLWDEIGSSTGRKFETQASTKGAEEGWQEEGTIRMEFSVRML